MQVNEGDEIYEDLREVHKCTNRASQLIRQLLLFSRKHPMEFKTINLNNTIDNLQKMLHRVIGEDIGVKTQLDPKLESVFADQGTMEQIIMNLAVNAKDAMPKGGQLTIKTRNVKLNKASCRLMPEASPGQFVCISLADTGIGMGKKVIQHIFDPFFSTKEPGKGTGLGLSVVYGIVKQHNGWIHVESTPGKGTVFEVYIPVVAHESCDSDSFLDNSSDDMEGRGKRILLVEDEEKVREFTTSGLNRIGFKVYSAGSANEAMKVFERENGDFDVVLSDVVLPDKSGLELVEILLKQNPNLGILLSSGYTDHKSRWPVIKSRGYRFLEKPYTLNDLLKVLNDTNRTMDA
jgi:CheY-like chemotaxis protein